jgi:hypothetical protein
VPQKNRQRNLHQNTQDDGYDVAMKLQRKQIATSQNKQPTEQ